MLEPILKVIGTRKLRQLTTADVRPYGIRELVRTGRIALDRDGGLGQRRRIRVVA